MTQIGSLEHQLIEIALPENAKVCFETRQVGKGEVVVYWLEINGVPVTHPGPEEALVAGLQAAARARVDELCSVLFADVLVSS